MASRSIQKLITWLKICSFAIAMIIAMFAVFYVISPSKPMLIPEIFQEKNSVTSDTFPKDLEIMPQIPTIEKSPEISQPFPTASLQIQPKKS